MTVYDQYETEPYVFYSGSYNDYVFRNISNIFQTTASASLNRRAIGTYSSGLFVSGFDPVPAGTSQIRNRLSPILASEFFTLYDMDGSGFFRARPQIKSSISLFNTHVSENEYYSDSILPNPADITLINGGQLIWARSLTKNALPTFDLFYNYGNIDFYDFARRTPVSGCFYICLGDRNVQTPTLNLTLTASTVGGSEQENVSDNIWLYSFPFQSRYKNATKITKNSSVLPKAYVATVSASKVDKFQEHDGVSTTLFLQNSPVTSSILAGVGVANYGTNIETALLFDGTNPAQSSSLPPPEQIFKYYYSYGNEPFPALRYPQKFPKTLTPALPFAVGFGIYGAIPRGYKYGASHYTLENTKAFYRRNRFGQLRDMLEQRLYTKFFDGDSMLSAGVSVSFVSGTIDYQQAVDYVNNTNPSYDPRDSGFWDYEYRSGQPFYDIDNID